MGWEFSLRRCLVGVVERWREVGLEQGVGRGRIECEDYLGSKVGGGDGGLRLKVGEFVNVCMVFRPFVYDWAFSGGVDFSLKESSDCACMWDEAILASYSDRASLDDGFGHADYPPQTTLEVFRNDSVRCERGDSLELPASPNDTISSSLSPQKRLAVPFPIPIHPQPIRKKPQRAPRYQTPIEKPPPRRLPPA